MKKTVIRDFLNPVTSWDSGSIKTDVFSGSDTDNRMTADIDMQIRDCSRQVNLNFSGNSKREIKQRLKKVALMKKHLDLVEECLNDAIRIGGK